MQTVKIRWQDEGVSGPISEMTTWLTRHGVEASLFELSFLPDKEVCFRIQFQNMKEAEAFAKAFNGCMIDGSEVEAV